MWSQCVRLNLFSVQVLCRMMVDVVCRVGLVRNYPPGINRRSPHGRKMSEIRRKLSDIVDNCRKMSENVRKMSEIFYEFQNL